MSLVMKDIGVSFGAMRAVSGASLIVEAGEIVVLFGPSGCGKTTLLRAAAGLERPDRGTIELGGAILSAPGAFVPPERREIGFVFQDYVLFPHMTVFGNVAFGLNAHPKEERARRAAAELAACGIGELAARYPHQLSGGQQQRAALARALARRPKAMLLDEPFAAIDAGLRARLRDDVRRVLKSAGAATILVTHDADEALALGDRIAVMNEGRIVEAARPEDLFARAKTIEGASVFGAQISPVWALKDLGLAFGSRIDLGPSDGVALLLPGAVRFTEHEGGAATVADCRFRRPDWRIDATFEDRPLSSDRPTAVGGRLSGVSDQPIAVGRRANAVVDPSLVRIFKL